MTQCTMDLSPTVVQSSRLEFTLAPKALNKLRDSARARKLATFVEG